MAQLYTSKTVKQLNDILKSRGLHCTAKRKAALVQALIDDDEYIASQDNASDDEVNDVSETGNAVESDDEIDIRLQTDVVGSESKSVESDNIVELRL